MQLRNETTQHVLNTLWT